MTRRSEHTAVDPERGLVRRRVLVVHNRYQSVLPSGENDAVDADVELLRAHGVGVVTWIRSSDEISTMSLLERSTLGVRPTYSRRDCSAVADLIDRFRPQVLHLHNPYPLVSPSVVRVAKARGVAAVQTVHNYRHTCLNGIHLRDGSICTLCVGRRIPWPAIRHSCYRGSRLQTGSIAFAQLRHRSTWWSVDRFLVFNSFMADRLIESGISADQIAIRQNFATDPGPPAQLGSGALFAGRLDDAKGVRLLLDAWELSGLDGRMPLVIAGDGPQRAEIERRADGLQSVSIVGSLDRAALADQFRATSFVVVPSLSYEGMPRVVLEALSHGRGVLVTRTGGLPDLVADGGGWVVEPTAASLAAGLRRASAGAASVRPRKVYERSFTPERSISRLLEIYDDVVR